MHSAKALMRARHKTFWRVWCVLGGCKRQQQEPPAVRSTGGRSTQYYLAMQKVQRVQKVSEGEKNSCFGNRTSHVRPCSIMEHQHVQAVVRPPSASMSATRSIIGNQPMQMGGLMKIRYGVRFLGYSAYIIAKKSERQFDC